MELKCPTAHCFGKYLTLFLIGTQENTQNIFIQLQLLAFLWITFIGHIHNFPDRSPTKICSRICSICSDICIVLQNSLGAIVLCLSFTSLKFQCIKFRCKPKNRILQEMLHPSSLMVLSFLGGSLLTLIILVVICVPRRQPCSSVDTLKSRSRARTHTHTWLFHVLCVTSKNWWEFVMFI